MPYRTSRQDRAAQTNLEGGRRRKPRYTTVLTDAQRAELEEAGAPAYDEDDYAVLREKLRRYEAQYGRREDDDDLPY